MESSTTGRASKKKKRSARMNINTALNNFASSASMHGVPRIINASSAPAKIFWSLVCVGAFLTFIWTGANLLNQYFSYPKKVNVEIIQRPVPFPSVTVCNTDHLDLQVVDRLEKVFTVANGSDDVDEFERKYQDYSAMANALIAINHEDSISSEKMKDSLEVLSRLGFVANVGPKLASKAGINAEDFIVNCRFMDEDCNISQTFVKVFDPYYFNCFTFQPQRILKSKSTRLSGVEYGLSLLLYVGCAGQVEKMEAGGEVLPTIPGMIESDPALVTGQGARVVVHSSNTMPLPTADGYDIPSGYSVSIGLRARENIRIGLPHGNCTMTTEEDVSSSSGDGQTKKKEGGSGKKGAGPAPYIYTLVSCQNECIQKMIMETCHCIDNRIPTLHSSVTDTAHQLPFCLQLMALPSLCNNLDAGGDRDMDLDLESFESIEKQRCSEIERSNAIAFNQRLECRKQVYENMTIRDPEAMDSCGCHPPCRDVVYDSSNSLSMLPENRREHAFYHLVDQFVDQMSSKRKKILKKKFGDKYLEYVKEHTSRVNVHIADSNIIKTTESPDYDLIRLVSDIGGQLGLWIGISVITLVEVLQLCADIFGIIIYQGRRLKGGDWKQELPKSKQNQQQVVSPNKMKGESGGSGGGLPSTGHHPHPHLRHQHLLRLHKSLSLENEDDDETTFEIDKMTSV